MWPNPQETADLVTFTEEILNGKLHFLRCEYFKGFNSTRLAAPRNINERALETYLEPYHKSLIELFYETIFAEKNHNNVR